MAAFLRKRRSRSSRGILWSYLVNLVGHHVLWLEKFYSHNQGTASETDCFLKTSKFKAWRKYVLIECRGFSAVEVFNLQHIYELVTRDSSKVFHSRRFQWNKTFLPIWLLNLKFDDSKSEMALTAKRWSFLSKWHSLCVLADIHSDNVLSVRIE